MSDMRHSLHKFNIVIITDQFIMFSMRVWTKRSVRDIVSTMACSGGTVYFY